MISLENYNYILTSYGELYHYGVKGMKWGHRKKIEYSGEGIVSRNKPKQPRGGINPNAGKPSLSTSEISRKHGSDISKAVSRTRKASSKAKSAQKNESADKAPSRAQKEKEDIQRMIEALDQHQKAQTMSFLNSATGVALRSSGQGRSATLLNEFGDWQVSRLSASSGYDFWR